MSRQIDATLAAGFANANIQPIILAALTFASGVVYVWSGVGNLTWNGNTYQGVGALGEISAISEGSSVEAAGMTVTLSGIPTNGLTIPYVPGATPPDGVTPPVAVPDGQEVAWATPTTAVGSGTDTITGCSAFYTGQIEEIGIATTGGGLVTLTGNCGLGAWPTFPYAQWSNFEINPGLPPGSTIEAIYPVALITSTVSDAFHTFFADISGTQVQHVTPGSLSNAQLSLASIGSDSAAMESVTMGYEIIQSETGNDWPDTATISFIGFAVYYTPGTTSLITETTDDIQLGAPANIYIGLMLDGEILGTPYLAFGGQVDQPTIRIGPDTMTISLSLENRLSNLQRANQRRYTSADQRQYYSDDTGFSWVEMLADEALRWG